MRSVQVSTDVYAAIWSKRQASEDSEDAILRRLLQIQPPPQKRRIIREKLVSVIRGSALSYRKASKSSGHIWGLSTAPKPQAENGS